MFQDNFDSENSLVAALNYNGFNNWSVSGVVDLIGNSYFDFLPGNGMYLDMDGSNYAAGTITTKVSSLWIQEPTLYLLSFLAIRE